MNHYLDVCLPIEPYYQPPLFSGHVKVSNLTPEVRSPCWMESGEGRGRMDFMSKFPYSYATAEERVDPLHNYFY